MRTALSRLRVVLQLAALAEGLTVGKLRPSQVRSRAHHGAVLVPALCWVDPLTAFCLLMWQVAFFSTDTYNGPHCSLAGYPSPTIKARLSRGGYWGPIPANRHHRGNHPPAGRTGRRAWVSTVLPADSVRAPPPPPDTQAARNPPLPGGVYVLLLGRQEGSK